MSLANISIVGNLAKEPEQYEFASGRFKTTLFVAVNSFNKIRKERTTDFYRVETWDKLAELAKAYLKKGNQVAVSGKIAMERWVDREGKERVTPTVQANQLAFPPRLRPVEKVEPAKPQVLAPVDTEVEPDTSEVVRATIDKNVEPDTPEVEIDCEISGEFEAV